MPLPDDLFFRRKPSLVEPGGLTFLVNALGRPAGMRLARRGFVSDGPWAMELKLFGGLEHFLTSHVLGIIIPID